MKLLSAFLLTCWSCSGLAAESNPDVIFFQKAAQGSLSEISAGDLAQRQSNNAALKDLAAVIVRDHTGAMHNLASLAASKEIELPPMASDAQSAKLTSLQPLAGIPFDKAYIEWQIGAHRDAIALFKAESTNGDDLDARQFAADTLPTLQKHLEHLLSITTESPSTPNQ